MVEDNFNISFRLGSILTDNDIDEIISIKDSVWPHPYQSHKKWMDNNLKPNDVHLMIRSASVPIAYLNMVNLTLKADSIFYAIGIGNVCVNPSFQGHNLGFMLVKMAEYHILQNKIPGILVCKDKIRGFYEKCGWQEFKGDVNFEEGKLFEHHLFVAPFAKNLLTYQKLIIDREF